MNSDFKTVIRLIWVLPLFFCVLNKAEAQKKIIEIQDYSARDHSPEDSSKHKFKDLEIFKLSYKDDVPQNDSDSLITVTKLFYEFCIWGGNKENPRPITFFEMFDIEKEFDKVNFNWDSDSLLKIKVRSKYKKDLKFEFYGDVLYLKEVGGPACRLVDNKN